MTFISAEVEGDIVVDFAFCESDIDIPVKFAVDKNTDSGVIVRFLHREQYVFAVACDSYKGVVASEMFDLDPFRGGSVRCGNHSTEHQGGSKSHLY